jgi:hypothetical protein
MRSYYRLTSFFRLALACALLLCCISVVTAQSTNQNYPTPITTNEITGSIKARDIGDNRVTSYYYQFDADQGDLFINILTHNFNGDIDVFTMTGLRPLTKIVVYADYGENETGRVLYFRKPEKMILRVQGRTPGDDPATFRIKFAGSFVASHLAEPTSDPELPSVTPKNDSGIRVNSVGTIVEVIPKATPTPRAVPTVADSVAEKPEPTKSETETEAKVETEVKTLPATEEAPKKLEVAVTENIPPAETRPATRRPGRGQRRTPPKPAPAEKPTVTTPTETPATVAETPIEKPTVTTETETTAPAKPPASRRATKTTKPPETKAPDPLASIKLVIQFKDGSIVQRPMSEVLRFSVDKGILTVIAKDGSIGRYSILDVAEVTIK